MVFDEAHRYMQQKVRKLDYTHTPLPDGYQDAEGLYKHFRDHLGMVSECVKVLANYEFGGQFFRRLAGASLLTTGASGLHALKREDMYTDTGRVGSSLKAGLPSDSAATTAAAFSAAYLRIGESKERMNTSLRTQQEAIIELQKRTKSIDDARLKVTNLRYDLESARQASPPKPPQETAKLEKDYTDTSRLALAAMTAFNGDHGMDGILQNIAAAHREFSEREVEALKNIG
ncbi:hypothetical protein [Streptomyces qinzhouensis]|uniref:Uncharacterized protein n=1 Tax=Streptomyces qinzhouensis TaxID=2599401 RepID=A0A5B8JE33_9ACTN|nr:hypothetical protein [Streptomyces qinzhouensis]QDY78191.1 hypothetical protein FQU76_18735 [Streptomyces qinzhouensis]